MSGEYIYLTKEGLAKLKDELNYLKNEKRVEIAEKLKEAISYWDLSENSEYEDARNEQAQIESRIIELEEQLKNVKLIEEDNTKKENKIRIWSQVTITNLETKEKETYKIVGSTESDIFANKISNESAVWKVLIWKKKWDSVKVKAHSGTNEYKIEQVS